MKSINLFLALLFTSTAIFSQINKIEPIDNYCSLLDSIIDEDSSMHTAFMVHTINFETNKRAIGKQYTSVMFYYPMPLDSVAETKNGTDFLYIYKPPVRISIEYNIAASQNTAIDYYFNDEGSLVFYQLLSAGAYGTETGEYYFSNYEMLKFEIHSPDKNAVKEKDFTRHELFLAGNISKNAKNYLKMFNNLVEFEQIDK